MVSGLKRFRSWAIGAAVGLTLVSGLAFASTWFNYFGPVNGILYGDAGSPQTRAAAAGDVESLWAGTCDDTTYLRGDGECATPPGSGGGTVNSVALTMPSGFTVTGSPITNTGTLAVSTTLSGVLLGTGSGFSTAAASDVVGLFSGCSGTDYLGADGACHAGGGTVTSVGLSAPSVFSVGSSPVTSSGTLALTFATGQTANEVLASPNGSSGAVSLRALVSADIPTVLNSVTSASSLATVGTIGTGTWQGTAVGAAYGGSGEAGTITGVLKGNGSSAYTAAAYGDVTGLWSGTCSSSTYLRGDGQCVTPTGGAGSVTSVALADGSTTAIFTVSGSPVTTSGTLTETLKTQSANAIFAGPTSGSAAQPNFRAMVAADLPLSSSPTWTGTTAWTQTNTGAFGQYLTNSSSGVGASALWRLKNDAGHDFQTALTSSMFSGAFLSNGPSGEQSDLYTNNSMPLALGTNGTARLIIGASGGVTVPDSSGTSFFSVGYLGAPPGTSCTTGCTIALADRGKSVVDTNSGNSVTVPSGVFSAGDVVTVVFYNGSGTITLVQGSGLTLAWANGSGSLVTGNRTMTAVAVVTIYFYSSTIAVVTGSGLS